MGKFKTPSDYLPIAEYELLPFNFDRLDHGRVLLTNMVGEHCLIDSEALERLVEHQMQPTDAVFHKLRAKHIIRLRDDSSPLELLGLKLRTKLSRLPTFTNLHLFVVTLRCDHSCQYCQVSRQSEDKSTFDMSIEHAEKALQIVFRSPNPAIKIEFQGGEPLLNFDVVKYVVKRAQEINKFEKRDLAFVITTTLSLVTDEILNFCESNSIHLSSSLDGPEDLHNKNRPRPGKDSYKRFVDGLSKARSILGRDSVSALMTTSPASMPRVKDIIDEYVSLGFNSIFLRHLSPYGFAIKTKSYAAYNVEKWLEFYEAGLDHIININKSEIDFIEQNSAILLSKMFTSRDVGFVDLMNPSGAGIAAVVFNYDGYVYPSDESRMLVEMGDTAFRMGHLDTHSYEELFTSDALMNALDQSFTWSSPMCHECAYEPWCGADPVFHHGMFGDFIGKKPESEFCKRIMGTCRILIRKAESDAFTKQLFMKWANRC